LRKNLRIEKLLELLEEEYLTNLSVDKLLVILEKEPESRQTLGSA
jgi:hypothetical protein